MSMIMKKPLEFFMVDAFTESAFKGNPAVVCFLDCKENERDDLWLQSLAAEFNVDLCAHATLASAHSLFSNGLVDSDQEIEFATHSGILTAKKVLETVKLYDYEKKKPFLIELDFPVIPTCEYNSSSDISMFSKALNGATIVDIRATTTDTITSKAASTDKIIPRMDDMLKCPGKLIIVTAAAPEGSVYDFCSRNFAPKLGVDEDSVCGSAHYWSLKMNKCDFVAYAASRRSGTVKVHYDKEKQSLSHWESCHCDERLCLSLNL
ncbi:unnamed protein product [Arabis nemorensis]|uniref:Uncharacterized protein n=1 Tax=Arabis nemorensis TaxID=586526 RepID=A0A565C088_9BRAS|nr:unnamed protein product [Arabis nemorensis]